MRLAFLILFLAFTSYGANPHWVAYNGAASWASAQSATPLSGTACASIATMNANATAGNTVNITSGIYTNGSIAPANSGTAASQLIFQTNNGAVTFTGAPAALYGLHLFTVSNVKVDGFIFTDLTRLMRVVKSSHSNEILNCQFYYSSLPIAGATLQIAGYSSNAVNYGEPATHNWFHHNTIHTSGSEAPLEGPGLMAVGTASSGDQGSSYNTIENNHFYHGGHHLIEVQCPYVVVRNNVFHNEGYKTDLTHVIGTATGGTTTTLTDTTRDFVADGVVFNASTLSFDYRVMHNLTKGNLRGAITGIVTNTNPNDTLVHAAISMANASGDSYDISSLYFTNYTGKYAHRCISLDNVSAPDSSPVLFENNRVGYATINPANNGADGITLSSRKNIIRHNALFGGDGPSIYFKNSGLSATNFVYANTVYSNGRYNGTQDSVAAVTKAGFQFTGQGQRIHNNLLWQNSVDWSISGAGSITNQFMLHNWGDSISQPYIKYTGDPLFVDTNTSDQTSQVLPDLRLQSTSGAINAGTNLTVAVGSGSASTTLIVSESRFFQDGTWGSGLDALVADKISVGTVDNFATISSIDYTTHTITLTSAITWPDQAPIWLYAKSDGERVLYGTAPDMGAYESQASLSVISGLKLNVPFLTVP